jgi:hypothetical protein
MFEGGGRLSFEIALRYNLFNIKPAISQVSDVDAFLRSASIRMIPVFSGLLPREEVLLPAARSDRERAGRHGEIVRNMLLALKREHKKRYKLLLDKLHDLYPDASLDVDHNEEIGKRTLSARIDSFYRDSVLAKKRDLIVAGSGLHQAVQILAGVLQPDATTILLDEPDAHLHARLQERLMSILEELADSDGLQFIIATHSPTLLRAAPKDSILICRQTSIVPFSPDPTSLEVLDSLGALDRMELVPLLQSRRVVFVENREDQRLLEAFARKHFGQKKAEDILRNVNFLYTYQEPAAAGVLDKARQVRDLLQDKSLESFGKNQPVRFLAVGDRDYRTDAECRLAEKSFSKKAAQPGFGFDLKLRLWRRAEIENYLLDFQAMAKCLAGNAPQKHASGSWSKLEKEFLEFLNQQVAAQRTAVCERFAARLQDRNRGLNLQTAMQQARHTLEAQWGDGVTWCDAKKVISSARKWAQDHKLSPHALAHERIVAAMDSVPDDVVSALRTLRRFADLAPKAHKTASRIKVQRNHA